MPSVTSKLKRHAEQLSALGHPARLMILRYVVQAGEDGASAGEIGEHLDIPPSTLSHHLDTLRDSGLLNAKRSGTFIYYAPDIAALRTLTDYLWEDCCKRGKGCC